MAKHDTALTKATEIIQNTQKSLTTAPGLVEKINKIILNIKV